MVNQMTGTNALRIIRACEVAADKCGSGELRGHKLLNALIEQGLDLIVRESPSEPEELKA